MPICLECVNWAPKPNDLLSRGGFGPCLAKNTPHSGWGATKPHDCSLFKQAPAEKVLRRRELFAVTGHIKTIDTDNVTRHNKGMAPSP